MEQSSIPTEKSGYLKEDFRLFHIKDQTPKEYKYHYHDFHKVIVFLSGKVSYHIEGENLPPEPVGYPAGQPRGDPQTGDSIFPFPTNVFILWIREDIREPLLNACFQKAADRSFSLIRLDAGLAGTSQGSSF